GEHEGVDLDERRVLTLVDLVKLDEDSGDLGDELFGESAGTGDLLGLGLVDAAVGVDLDLRERLGALNRELFDLHAALDAAQRQVGAVGPVEQHGEVELLLDAGTLGNHDALDDMTLDVEAENLLGCGERVVGVVNDLDAASLATTTDLDLSLD